MANFSPTHSHERSDAQVRPVAIFLICMFASVLMAYGIITVLFEYLSQRQISKYGNPTQFAMPAAESHAPLLQVVPGLDLHEIRAGEAEQLDGYGWVDRRQGLVHVPIEQAMKMLVDQHVPARAASPAK